MYSIVSKIMRKYENDEKRNGRYETQIHLTDKQKINT